MLVMILVVVYNITTKDILYIPLRKDMKRRLNLLTVIASRQAPMWRGILYSAAGSVRLAANGSLAS